MKLATCHYYRGGAEIQRDDDRLLFTRHAFDGRLTQLHGMSAPRAVEYRINEVNSFSGVAKKALADTFGSPSGASTISSPSRPRMRRRQHGNDINQLGLHQLLFPPSSTMPPGSARQGRVLRHVAFAMAGVGQLLKSQHPR